MGSDMTNARSPKSRDGVDQDQFLTILSREEAIARFEAALFPRAIPHEQRPLSDALGGVLAADIAAPIDVPPFDRSNVDGCVGIAEIVLLEKIENTWMPLSIGEMSLDTIARADAWLQVAGLSEGFAAGTAVDAYMLRD